MTATTTSPQVILVDRHDQSIGITDKLTAHQQNLCHRAFSVCLTRQQHGHTELLLQQRQATKYHGKNLWSNTCCSHPAPGEILIEAAKNRLDFEMGIQCQLTWIGHLYYQATMEDGLSEHEFDHIFHGDYDQEIAHFNPDEVAAVTWMPIVQLRTELKETPKKYTPWLAQILDKLTTHPPIHAS